MSSYCTEIYKGYKIEINQDESAENPRDWDNMGTMVCFHKKYKLGDDHDFDSFDAPLNLATFIERKDVYSLPLYLFDHSGITIQTTPFPCHWDSGQIGYIYITKEDLKKNNLHHYSEDGIFNLLKTEIEYYDNYLQGFVYGYTIPKLDDDSCWGYYEHDHLKSGILQDAKSAIDFVLRRKQKKKHKRIKAWIKHNVSFNYRIINEKERK